MHWPTPLPKDSDTQHLTLFSLYAIGVLWSTMCHDKYNKGGCTVAMDAISASNVVFCVINDQSSPHLLPTKIGSKLAIIMQMSLITVEPRQIKVAFGVLSIPFSGLR